MIILLLQRNIFLPSKFIFFLKPLFDFLATVLNQKFLSSMTSLPRGADSFFITTPDNPKPPASTPVTERPSPNETKEESGYCNII